MRARLCIFLVLLVFLGLEVRHLLVVALVALVLLVVLGVRVALCLGLVRNVVLLLVCLLYTSPSPRD